MASTPRTVSLPFRPHRTRWAAIGAVVAICLGSGGLFTASASVGSGTRTVFVPIPPCRLFDTRPGSDNVGGRSTPLSPGDVFVATVRGTNGNCSIPADAVGVSMNVTIIQPSSPSFLTVFPADAPRPLAANLNWVAGQAPTPNAVTSQLSADGKVAFYNLAGTVNVAADVNGYYADHTHDDRYYTKAQLDSGPSNIGRVGQISASQIGQGRWDQDRGRPLDVSLGSEVDSLAFDGTHLWAASWGALWVKELDPASGTVLATVTDPAFSGQRLAFDGRRIWVSNAHGKLVGIDAATAAITARPTLPDGGAASGGAAFDGARLWVALPDVGLAQVDVGTNAVTTIPATAGLTLVLFDGTYIWATNPAHDSLSRVTIATGDLADPMSTLLGSPTAIATDGQLLYVAEESASSANRLVHPINPATGSYVPANGTFSDTPTWYAVVWDGRQMWTTGHVGNAPGGDCLASFRTLDMSSTSLGLCNPRGHHLGRAALSDGTSIWLGTDVGVLKVPDR